ncbi:luciferin sulfotransferase-like [Pararge aegeria]|uniref:luciferin sulfotransferase-like n=1 Tax=Pararge aegeria TaxID=116150 RepID=UPI0019D090CC|nr:luciferin sulfotransferase-like [Pararge aegeria]
MDKKLIKDFPYEYEIVDPEKNEDLVNYFCTPKDEYVTIGPKKYFLLKGYLSGAARIYNFPLSSEDTFVITYPKSGTTLTQELVWLLGNNLDYEKAESININERFPFLEISAMLNIDEFPLTADLKKELKKSLIPVTLEQIEEMPSPRFIKSHLPLSLLPPSLLDTTKVVYIARDPRDVAVSYYKFQQFLNIVPPEKEFKQYWKFFMSNQIMWTPYFEHVLEAWEQRKHPNMLFLFYEDMLKDLTGAVRRVADFYGKTLLDDQVNNLARHLDFDTFKKNKSVNMEDLKKTGIYSSDGAFIRKGKAGGWRNYFDEEMSAQADEWIAKHLSDTDFRLPHC